MSIPSQLKRESLIPWTKAKSILWRRFPDTTLEEIIAWVHSDEIKAWNCTGKHPVETGGLDGWNSRPDDCVSGDHYDIEQALARWFYSEPELMRFLPDVRYRTFGYVIEEGQKRGLSEACIIGLLQGQGIIRLKAIVNTPYPQPKQKNIEWIDKAVNELATPTDLRGMVYEDWLLEIIFQGLNIQAERRASGFHSTNQLIDKYPDHVGQKIKLPGLLKRWKCNLAYLQMIISKGCFDPPEVNGIRLYLDRHTDGSPRFGIVQTKSPLACATDEALSPEEKTGKESWFYSAAIDSFEKVSELPEEAEFSMLFVLEYEDAHPDIKSRIQREETQPSSTESLPPGTGLVDEADDDRQPHTDTQRATEERGEIQEATTGDAVSPESLSVNINGLDYWAEIIIKLANELYRKNMGRPSKNELWIYLASYEPPFGETIYQKNDNKDREKIIHHWGKTEKINELSFAAFRIRYKNYFGKP